MKLYRSLFKFSKFQEKLRQAQSKAQGTDQQPKTNETNLPSNDYYAEVRNTGSSIIYYNQPENDTINMLDIDRVDPNFHKSRKGEGLHFKISGEESQVAIVDIYPGEKVRSESDKIIFMTEGVTMTTTTGGGMGSMFRRFVGGSSLFVTDYTYDEQYGYGRVAFAETFPSKIIPIRLDDYGGAINCKKGSYICSSSNIDVNIAFSKRISTGFFGGEGFVLQSITQTQPGQTVLLRAGGSVIKRELRDGEKLKVSPGLVVAFHPSVHYDIEMIKMTSVLNIFGGARSLFQATFTGPGTLYLQTLSFEHLVEEIISRSPSRGGGGVSAFPFFGGGGSEGRDEGDVDEN